MNAAHEHMVKVFRACVILSFCIVITAAVLSLLWKDAVFAMHAGVAGMLNVGFFAIYMGWIAHAIALSKRELEKAETGDAGTQIVSKIQVFALIKFFATAVLLITLVVGFRFQPLAVLIGIAGTYFPYIIVPLFIRPKDLARPDPSGSAEDSEGINK